MLKPFFSNCFAFFSASATLRNEICTPSPSLAVTVITRPSPRAGSLSNLISAGSEITSRSGVGPGAVPSFSSKLFRKAVSTPTGRRPDITWATAACISSRRDCSSIISMALLIRCAAKASCVMPPVLSPIAPMTPCILPPRTVPKAKLAKLS